MSATTLGSLRVTFAPALAGLAVGLAAWALLFFPECQAAIGVWRSSDTYGHCFLILPMALYLAWDRREALAGITPQPILALAPLALPIAAAWFAAERLGIMEGRQLAALAALELLFLCVLGLRLFRVLLAPLLFLVFLVPFGAFATPLLQDITAAFVIGGLNLLGIPNYATDLTIEISAGTFYVAEACAGLRFLIAAMAFGVFYALLNYRSPGRRALFMAASIIVPVIANGLRALGIVLLGAILGSAEAAAADHIIYGWIFFSFVMLLLVAGGMPFREAPPGSPDRRTQVGSDNMTPGGMAFVRVALTVAALLASGPAVAMVLTSQAMPVRLMALPTLAVPSGCATDGAAPTLPAQRVTLSYQCQGMPLLVTIQAFPPRSTADSLLRERRRITGELAAEEVVVAALPVAQAENGSWSLIRTIGPVQTTAVAIWTDGVPARGGLSGRIGQARNSLLGSSYAPILITAAIEQRGRTVQAERQRGPALLRAFVDAQTALTAQIATVSQSARP